MANYLPLRKNESTKVFTNKERVNWFSDEMDNDPSSSVDTLYLGPLKNDTTVYVTALSDFSFVRDTLWA